MLLILHGVLLFLASCSKLNNLEAMSMEAGADNSQLVFTGSVYKTVNEMRGQGEMGDRWMDGSAGAFD